MRPHSAWMATRTHDAISRPKPALGLYRPPDAQIESATPPRNPRPGITFSRFVAEVYHPARLTRRSKGHATQIELTVRRFLEFAGDPEIDRIDEATIDGFKVWRKASAATVNKDLRNLRAILNLAKRRKYRTDEVAIEFEPTVEDPVEAWSVEQFCRILASCRRETGDICGIPADRWWAAQQLVILNVGARISAVMQARMDDLDWERSLLRIRGSTQKHRRGQIDPLHPKTMAALVEIASPTRELLFPWPYDRNVIQWPSLIHHYRRILARAGLPTTAKDLFHKLRRTNATFICAAADEETARRQLGHSSVEVTRRYLDPTKISKRRTAAELLPWDQVASQPERQLRLF